MKIYDLTPKYKTKELNANIIKEIYIKSKSIW